MKEHNKIYANEGLPNNLCGGLLKHLIGSHDQTKMILFLKE